MKSALKLRTDVVESPRDDGLILEGSFGMGSDSRALLLERSFKLFKVRPLSAVRWVAPNRTNSGDWACFWDTRFQEKGAKAAGAQWCR